jgi:drug/metabolite transporter (DMT)-like permease
MTDAAAPVAAAPSRLRVGLAATAGGFWFVSISPVIVAGSGVHGLVMAFWRSWIGFAALAVVVFAKRQHSLELVRRSGPAGLCFGVSIGLFFWASQLTSIANASLIAVLQPIPLMIAAHFVFSEELVRRDLSWVLTAIGGAIFLVLASDSAGTSDIKGDGLALVAILVGSGYFVFAKRALETMSVLPFMVGMFGWAGAVLTPMVLISGERIPASTGADWLRVLAVASVPGVGHFLLNYAHGKAPLHMMGVLQLVIPVNATLMAFWFLDQSVSGWQIVGMAVVMSALTAHALTRFVHQPAGTT